MAFLRSLTILLISLTLSFSVYLIMFCDCVGSLATLEFSGKVILSDCDVVLDWPMFGQYAGNGAVGNVVSEGSCDNTDVLCRTRPVPSTGLLDWFPPRTLRSTNFLRWHLCWCKCKWLHWNKFFVVQPDLLCIWSIICGMWDLNLSYSYWELCVIWQDFCTFGDCLAGTGSKIDHLASTSGFWLIVP